MKYLNTVYHFIGRRIAPFIRYVLQIFGRLVSFLLSPLFSIIAKYGYGSNYALHWGFLPVPVHYYSPIPDVGDLKKREIWSKVSPMYGIDFNVHGQIKLLSHLGSSFGNECVWPLTSEGDDTSFHLANDNFSYGCAAALYSMIRHFHPKRFIEIGSGNSSKIISQALKTNSLAGHNCEYTIIDPYPRISKTQIEIFHTNLIADRVEMVDPNIFEELQENDILFIDSSHVVKIGDDVNFLFLDIIPKLKPGVIIHVHDISLPDEYPSSYALSETFRQFWTEQYLLQAYLSHNQDIEILLAMHFLQSRYANDFQKAFSHYNPSVHKLISGSFWFRNKPPIMK